MYAPSLSSTDPPIDDGSLERLIQRSRSGDMAAFDAFVDRYYRVTFGLAFRMLGNREAAQDATQEIFLKAWRNLRRFQGASRFSTWLHTIAVNHCLDTARKRSRDSLRCRSLEALEGPEEKGEIRPSRPEEWELTLTLSDALARLSEKLRVIVILRYYSGHSVKEISEALDLPVTTIYSRLDMALKKLKKIVGQPEEA